MAAGSGLGLTRYRDAHIAAVGKKHSLKPEEYRIVHESAYIDSEAVISKGIDISALIGDLLTGEHRAIAVTIFLPVDLSFPDERDLRGRIVGAGGSVALRRSSETFQAAVEDRMRRLGNMEIRVPDKLTPPIPLTDKPNIKAFEPYFYSPDELRALQEAYSSEDDSSSVVS